LKPENAVVDYKGKLLLVDLGTAVILKAEKFYKTFTIIGTPHYMARRCLKEMGILLRSICGR
jgi:cGMP-dependent protein kinase